jgi:hypothetical protein
VSVDFHVQFLEKGLQSIEEELLEKKKNRLREISSSSSLGLA